MKASARTINYWGRKGYAAGILAASQGGTAEDPVGKVNERWNKWQQSTARLPWPVYCAAASRFVDGYRRQTGGHFGNWALIPTTRTVAAIVTVMNEEATIPRVLEQLHRLPLHEIIVVVNGSTDESFEFIRNQSQAAIVYYHHPLGHDVGRAIGAKLAESDILVFLDGDFAIQAEQLVPFIAGIERGLDIALNNLTPHIGIFSRRDHVTMFKEFVNRSMVRSDLNVNSLTAIPHAMSKRAAELIGYANLSVPPKAQVIAAARGLKIGSPASVDVISKNRVRAHNVGRSNPVSELIIGDHIEALKAALDMKGSRLAFADRIRRRQLSL